MINRFRISEIAYSVGFDTPSYFSASFKAFYGVTPSQYGKVAWNVRQRVLPNAYGTAGSSPALIALIRKPRGT